MTATKPEVRTCAQIEDEIRVKRAAQDRMPAHWVERHGVVGDAIDDLVTEWLALH